MAYSSDAKNFAGVLGSMFSLVSHMEEPSQCTIHFVVERSDMEKAARLIDCLRQALPVGSDAPAIELHTLTEVNMSDLHTSYRRHLIKQQTFARLYLHAYLPPSVRRVLWLDHDTIIRSDVRPLYQMQMRHAIAVTWDQASGDTATGSKLSAYAPFLSRNALRRVDVNARVFSTAVMLMDLDKWRSGNITEEVMGLVRFFSGVEGDQLAVNVHFGSRADTIPWTWNVMGLGFIPYRMPQHCIDKARVLHWAGANKHKPWSRHWSRMTFHDDLFEPYDLRRRCEVVA
mmetsp:Transcript_48890/g.98580  ORF Transcript_48890/g.98580 Transcript_48890/m.98580 type:complete len:286 (+) Transcript_48890:212-1069(+)